MFPSRVPIRHRPNCRNGQARFPADRCNGRHGPHRSIFERSRSPGTTSPDTRASPSAATDASSAKRPPLWRSRPATTNASQTSATGCPAWENGIRGRQSCREDHLPQINHIRNQSVADALQEWLSLDVNHQPGISAVAAHDPAESKNNGTFSLTNPQNGAEFDLPVVSAS